MPNEPVVHVIDDDEAMRDSLQFMLDAAGLQARTWESAVSFAELLLGKDYEVHGIIRRSSPRWDRSSGVASSPTFECPT